MDYCNLHIHTEYSNASCCFLDCMNKLTDVIDYAIKMKMPGVAITDHETLSAHIPAEQYLDSLIKNAKEEDKEYLENFKLLRGNEIYLAKDDMSAATYQSGDTFYHFILIALDKEGHDQLRELSNRAWHRSFFRAVQRRFNYLSDLEEVIGSNKGHLIGTTACIGGITGTTFLRGGTKENIKGFIDYFKNVFGEENFFIELAPPSSVTPDQENYNRFMMSNFADEQFVISTDAHYLEKKDFPIFKAFLNSKQTKEREVENFYSTSYFMDWDEISKYCNKYDVNFLEKCRLNSLKICERAKDFRLKRTPIIPQIKIPNQFNIDLKCELGKYEFIDKYYNSEFIEDRYLLSKVFENYDSLIDSKFSIDTICERINLELSELWGISAALNQRMSNYLITEAKNVDIIWEDADAIVGPSRGSAGSWVVNYLLGITQWNPLDHPLEMKHWRLTH